MSSMAGRDTEEYQKILTRYDTIINQLASAKCSGVLADKLRSRQLITGAIYEEALNVGPGVVESTRIRTMINAVLARVELNTENYYTFMGILQEIDGTEDTVQYMEAPLQQLGLQNECAVSGPGNVTEWSATWDASGRFIPHDSSPVNRAPPLEVLVQLPVAMKWYQVGLQLGVRADVLDRIKAGFSQSTNMCKMMFAAWLRDDINPSYEKLVKVLAAVGDEELAEYVSTVKDNQTPSLQALTLLPVAAQWYDLGLHLGVKPDVLDAIMKTSRHETELCEHMFTVWLRDDPRPTYKKLARALAAVGKRNLAEPLLAARGIPLSVIEDIAAIKLSAKPPISPSPECVVKYAKYLKEKYKRMSVLPDGDWPPSIGRHYTRLALVENPRELLPDAEFISTMERDYFHGKIDKIVGRKKEIQIPEIFTENPSKTQLKILMDGAPGVGKTTLSRKMVCDWANGVLLEQFHLVILLHLRDPRVREAKSIKELFPNDGPQFQQDAIQHIKDTAGEHVLFIFDAYDELSYEERTCSSLFLDIIEGRSLHNCSVLVTSRPYASDHLQQLNCINRHVEVLGFTTEQVESCIKLAIPDEEKATSLVKMLQERSDIISLCYIPLNCAIMLFVYKQEKYTLPDTLTELYEAFIVNSLKQHARNLSTIEKKLLNSATSLHRIPQSVMKQLDALSKVALEGLSEDKMIFSYNDDSAFSDYVSANMEENFLGLMTSFSRTTHTDYQFIHLSVQEFLAARWAATQLVQLSDAEQVAYFQCHIKEDRFRLMLLFLAGILQLNFEHAHQILTGPIDLRCCEQKFVPPSKVHFFFFILQLVFETKRLSLYRTLKIAITDHAINICWNKLTAFDCVLLAHFLHLSNFSWKLLNLYGCGLTDHSLEILHKVSLSQPSSTTCIEEVDLSYCSFSTLPQITWFENTSKLKIKGASPFFDVIHTIGFMKHLHELRIEGKEDFPPMKLDKLTPFSLTSGNFRIFADTKQAYTFSLGNGSLNICVFSSILKIPYISHLVGLDLSRNKALFQNCTKCSITRESALGALHHFLKTSSCLSNLVLSDCGLRDNDIEHIAVGLADNVSVKKLNISGNKIGGRAIGNILIKAGSLTYLNISGCGLSDNDAEEIAPGLAKNGSIKQMDISENQLSAQGVILIVNSNNTVSSFDIGNQFGNPKSMCGTELLCYIVVTIPNSGDAEYIFRVAGLGSVRIALSDGQKTICLENPDEVTVEGCKYIFQLLQDTSVMFRLRKTYNTLPSDAIVNMFRLMEYNTNLVEVDFSFSRQFELTKFENKTVGQALERMLRMNTGIRTLKLYCCKISDDMAKRIGLGLAGNKSLRVLNIGSNGIHSNGTVSIFTSLEHNSSLEKLILSNNHLSKEYSEAVGQALERMLRRNTGIQTLKLNSCKISDDMAKNIGLGLTGNKSLKVLDIGRNDIHSDGAVSIFTSLEHNTSTTLEELHLSGNHWLSVGDSEAVGWALEKLLTVNCTLKVLYLSYCGLNDVVLYHLATGLTHTTCITELDISNCYSIIGNKVFHAESWVHLFKALCHNSSLKKLDISRNKLGLQETEALAEMLACNKSLTELKIKECYSNWNRPATIAKLEVLARGLLNNMTVQRLVVDEHRTCVKEFLEARLT